MDKSITFARRLALIVSMLMMMSAYVHGQSFFINLTLLETALPKGAVCLDGSLPSYTYREGYGNGSSSWIVFMEGGGWCESKEDCFYRSQEYLGSSNKVPNRGLRVFSGILDSDIQLNPSFYNWHKVYIHYCDGSLFLSDVEQVTVFEGRNLYFRGGRVFKAMMEEMLQIGMRNAKNAILTGSASGGLTTILHCDEFRKLFASRSRVKCISDSGFYLRGDSSLANYSERPFARVVATHELAGVLPRSCTAERDPKLCLFPEFLVGDVSTPLFLVESAFNDYQIANNFISSKGYGTPSLWKNCLNDIELCSSRTLGIIKDFKPIFVKTLLQLDNSSSRGMFVDSCFTHTHILSGSYWTCSPFLKNKTMRQAVADWFFDRSSFREIDPNDLPQKCYDPDNDTVCSTTTTLDENAGCEPKITSFIFQIVVFICLYLEEQVG